MSSNDVTSSSQLLCGGEREVNKRSGGGRAAYLDETVRVHAAAGPLVVVFGTIISADKR